MKGIIFEGKHKVTIKDDLIKPEITEDEVLIKIKKVGICGTGVGSYETGGPFLPGIIIGHEFSGEIVAIGENVKKLKIGSKVTVNPQIPCGECYYCIHHQENMCKLQNYSLGTTEDGAMREFINVRSERVHILPDNVSFENGAIVEPLSIAINAVQESGFKIGDNAAVIGAGPIGLFVVQVLKASGADKIFVLEPVDSKRKKALELGAIKAFEPKTWSKIVRSTNRIGPDHIFDCVGLSSTISTSLSLIKKGGCITLIGMHAKSFEINKALLLTTNNITLKGVYGYTQDVYKTAINLLEQGKVNGESIITNHIKIEDVPQMFEKLANPPHDELKVIVDFD
ncbi:MAG: zinc-dependent alcohol dehydrogenase [Promethearchaeota archaeon]|jgi:2-desacetyl-2-hydroxyethyl bacteriochlorophyllide A dehydrogenase